MLTRRHDPPQSCDDGDPGVEDAACESYDVDRLFVADRSVLANDFAGPTPSKAGQGLVAFSAEKIGDRILAYRTSCQER